MQMGGMYLDALGVNELECREEQGKGLQGAGPILSGYGERTSVSAAGF